MVEANLRLNKYIAAANNSTSTEKYLVKNRSFAHGCKILI